MQRYRISNRTSITILRNKPTRRSIHIPCSKVIQTSSLIKLLTAITITILGITLRFQQIAKCIISVGISNLTILISKPNNRAVSVIKIYRHFAVTFLRNKVSTNRIDTLRRAIFVNLCQNIGKA